MGYRDKYNARKVYKCIMLLFEKYLKVLVEYKKFKEDLISE